VPVIPVIHRSRAARVALRRGLPRRGVRVMSCRAMRGVETVLQREVVDAIVLDLRPGVADAALQLAARYPRIPLFALTPFRPHEGGLMLACRRAGMRVLQAGVDDPVAGELVATRTATLRRRAALPDAPPSCGLPNRCSCAPGTRQCCGSGRGPGPATSPDSSA
jgi:hypothetical protein